MVAHDRIRLTGPLKRGSPRKRGASPITPDMTNDSGVKVLWDSLRGSVIDSKGREMSGSVRFAAPAALAVALLFAAVAAMSLPCLLYTSPSPRDGLLSRMPS